MIVQQNFLNKLKDFGLNTYEGKIWTALLSRGISTAGELSDIANVPRSRSYDVLESLEKKGFVIVKLGKPIKYIAVSPNEVIERIKKKLTTDIQEKTMLIDELKESNLYDELTLLHNQGVELLEPTEMTGAFRGRSSIYNHLESMIKKAEKSIVIMTTEDGLKRKHEKFKKHLTKASQKGVKIQVVSKIGKKNDKVSKELAKFATVKDHDNTVRFCIFDGKELLFMLTGDDSIHPSYDVGVWVNTPYFVSFFENIFQRILEKK